DLIVSRPTAPEAASARLLITREFFRLAASRLKPGGVFAQVVPLQGMGLEDVTSVLKTLQAAFRDVAVMQTYYQELLILASEETLQFDLTAMRRVLKEEKIRSDLARIGIVDPESLVVRYRLAGKGAEIFARTGRLLRDGAAPARWNPYRTGGEAEVGTILDRLDRTSTGLAQRVADLADGAPGNTV